MRRMAWLAGLVLAGSSLSAAAAAPSYDYLQFGYVGVSSGDTDIDYHGADLQVSALIAPYLIFGAGYEFLESEEFQLGLVEGRRQRQFVTGGLAARIPMVRNVLEGTIGADFIYADVKNRGDFEGVFDDDYDIGYQVKGTLRANFRYFEVIPSVRYIDVFDDHDLGVGIQLLGCFGYGICATGGYEWFKDSEDHRYFAGLRLYYN